MLTEAQLWLEQHTDQLSPDECSYIGASNDLQKREQQAAEEQRQHELAQARALAKEHARARTRAMLVAGVVLFAALGLAYLA
jgi:hypothetical protein